MYSGQNLLPVVGMGTFICVMLEQVRPLDDGSIIFIMMWAHLMIKKGDLSAHSLYSVPDAAFG